MVSAEQLIALILFLTIIGAGIAIFGIIGTLLHRKNQKIVTKAIRRLKGSVDPSNLKFTFIINPSKTGASELRHQIERYFKYRNLKQPAFVETTIEFPGNKQAGEAAQNGSDVIVACGGDGTVRSVACGIAKSTLNSQVQMGIIPIGTGNLLARNLNLPIGETELALDTVVYGKAYSIDLGWATKLGDEGNSHAFAVIAGVGFDANMVKETNPNLKKRIGFLAYFFAGAKQAFAKKIDVEMEITFPDGETKTVFAKLRSIMVGNCGRIPGFTLIPEADFRDGLIDIVAVDTAAGILGWGQIATDVFLQNFGISIDSKFKMGRIEHIQAKSLKLTFTKEQEIDVDGDLIGKAKGVSFAVAESGLLLRLPKGQ